MFIEGFLAMLLGAVSCFRACQKHRFASIGPV